MENITFKNVDEYIMNFPDNIQEILYTIRKLIQQNAPDAIEMIAYKMPAYKLHDKPLLYFAGYKNHIGLYATPTGHEHFFKELSQYKQGKGSVQFPIDEAIPYELISRIVSFRVDEITSTKKTK